MSQENNSYVSDWFIVPSRIRRLPGMTLAYLDVFETIFQFLNKGKNCFLTNLAISERTGLSIRQAQRALNFYVKHGELKRVLVGTKYYFVVPEKRIEAIVEEEKNESTNDQTITTGMTGGDDSRVVGGMTAVSPINKEYINKEKLKNKEKYKKEKNELEVVSKNDQLTAKLFEEMWKMYPLKKAKQKALEALKGVVSGIGLPEAEKLAKTIWGGFSAHVAEHQAKLQLKQQGADIWVPELPHLTTWLNQRRWEDDYQSPEDILRGATRKKPGLDLEAFESQWKYN